MGGLPLLILSMKVGLVKIFYTHKSTRLFLDDYAIVLPSVALLWIG